MPRTGKQTFQGPDDLSKFYAPTFLKCYLGDELRVRCKFRSSFCQGNREHHDPVLA
jgi:hypothetical protein